MPKGWPDFTVPITIEAVTVETLPVDIKAQTLGTVAIDIAAQSMVGNLDVNINLASVAMPVSNLGSIVNPGFEKDWQGWIHPTADVFIDNTVFDTGIKSVKIGHFNYVFQNFSPSLRGDVIKSWTVRYRCSVAGTNKGFIKIRYDNGIDQIVYLSPAAKDTWYTGTIVVNPAWNVFSIELWGWAGSGNYMWFDTVSLSLKEVVDVVTPTVKIDITAQSIATLGVDIKAQSVGNLNVNIAASAVTLNVAIQSSAVTLNVNITGSVALDVNITGSVALSVNASQVGTWAVNASQVGTWTVQADIISSVTLTANAIQSGTWNVGQVGTWNVHVASSVTLNVSVQGTASVSIDAATVSLNVKTTGAEKVAIDIAAQTLSQVDVNIAAQTANVNVNIAAQAADINVNVTNATINISGSVTITSGTVNVQTSGAANIVIDKLTQAAYTARSVTMSNDNGVTSPTAPPSSQSTTYWSKWFPRGCRGFLYVICVYCKRTAAGTITLGYSVAPGMGEIGTVTITPGSSWDWKPGIVNKMWNYDSLFIYVKSCSADVSYGLEYTTTNPDAHSSADSGATWSSQDYRVFIRPWYRYQTVGDLPVSGTLNTIEVPSTSSGENTTGLVSLPTGEETTLMTVPGAGHMDWFSVNVSHSDIELKIYCDGVLAFWDNAASLNAKGIGATTPGVQLPVYNVGAGCMIASTLRFEFTRELRFTVRNDTGAEKNATVYNTLITMLK